MALKNVQLESYTTQVSAEVDTQSFFNGSGVAPWTKGVDMTVTMESATESKESLEETAHKAHE
jgi:hypothetical protein